ncbi:MAG: BsuPI-related putative proteinase inhibitor [Halobacteriota archaeon]
MLEPTLTVEPTAEGVSFEFCIENVGRSTVELRFRSGQRVEFVAESNGEPVWRWSDGRLFTMAIETDRLEPFSTRTYTGTWIDPPAGTYTIRGELAADSHDVSASIEVDI